MQRRLNEVEELIKNFPVPFFSITFTYLRMHLCWY